MNIVKMREAAERPTVRKWKWFTSNSHVRLSDLDSGKDGDVICAFKANDGYPVVSVNQYVMRFIEEFSPSAAVELLDSLQDAQKRIAELEANAGISQQARDELLARAIKAEEELARREAAKGEPVAWQFYDDGNWYNGVNNNGHRRNTEKAGYRVRDLYPAPQPATLPSELDNDSGFVDLYRNGYNKAISDARELGCKSAPIVELPPDYSHSPDFTEYHLGWNRRENSDKEQLEAAGIKWKIID